MRRLGAIAIVVLIAGAAFALASGSQAASHKKAPVTVPLAILGGVGTAGGAHPSIRIKVGNGPTVPVILDGGSVGLHIYAPGVKTGPGGGVTKTRTADSIMYVDGTVQTGVVAKAKITIGGLTTSKAIPFGLITKVGCTASIPDCPTQAGISAAVRKGEYGVMGVRYQPVPSGTPGNPLIGLPAPYSGSWSISMRAHGGKLVLGAPAATGSVLHFAGSPPKTTVCWTIGSIKNICEPTLFDTGDPGMVVYGGPLATAPTAPGSTLLQPGTLVSATAKGSSKPFWTFTAGTTESKNTVRLHPPGLSGDTVNASIAAYFACTLTWNVAKRTLTLSPPG